MKTQILTIAFLVVFFNSKAQTILDNDYIIFNKKIDSLSKLNQGYDYKKESNSKLYTQLEKGVLIKKDGTQVPGMIKIKKKPISEVKPIKIEFAKTDLEKTTTFRADKIKGFYKGNRKYLSKRIEDMPSAFLEVLDTGMIDLYIFKCYDKYSDLSGTYKVHLYIETENKPIIEINSKKLAKHYLDYFEKHKGIQSFIASEHYNKEIVREVIQLYNELVNKSTANKM